MTSTPRPPKAAIAAFTPTPSPIFAGMPDSPVDDAYMKIRLGDG